MKTTFAHKYSQRLLHLYPRAWRERYADEAAAVLEERPATLRTLFDLFLGMLDAHLHAELFTERKFVMIQRLRNSQITIFGSFVCFAIAWAIYSFIGTFVYRTGVPVWDLASPTPDYAFVFPLVRMLGLFAILTTLLGGCAFIGVALKQSFARNRQNIAPAVCILLSMLVVAQAFGMIILLSLVHGLAPIIAPFLGLILPLDVFSFLLFALLGNVLRLRQGIKNAELSLHFMLPTLLPGLVILTILGSLLIFYSPALSFYFFAGRDRVLFILFAFLVFVGIIGGSFVYLARQLRRIEFSPRLLRFTFILASLTVLAMGVILSLLLYEAQVIYSHVNEQGWKLLSVPFLGAIVVCAALPTIFAGISLWRAFDARRELVPA